MTKWIMIGGDDAAIRVGEIYGVSESIDDAEGGGSRAVVYVESAFSGYRIAAGPTAVNRKKAAEKRTLTARQMADEIDRLEAGKAQTLVLSTTDEPASIPAHHKAHERGKWLPATLYVGLDIVQHPTAGTHHVCLQKHQSNAASVLDDARFWAKVELPLA